MSVNQTMKALYIAHERFESLAKQLEEQGCKMAAEELQRESKRFGCQLTQLESVFDDYQIDISAVQLSIGIPMDEPRWIGVDMGKADLEHFKKEGAGRTLRLEK